MSFYRAPQPDYSGPASTKLLELAETHDRANPLSLFHENPDVHPGLVAPMFRPKSGTVSPRTSPSTITGPHHIAPSSAPRGLGFGVVTLLVGFVAGTWIQKQFDVIGVQTEDNPAGATVGCVRAAVESAGETATETAPQLQPKPIGPKKPVRIMDDEDKEGAVRRWRIYGRSRASKTRRVN